MCSDRAILLGPQDLSADIRQSAFALVGDLAKVAPSYLSPSLPQLVQLTCAHLQPAAIQTASMSACNNACWSLGDCQHLPCHCSIFMRFCRLTLQFCDAMFRAVQPLMDEALAAIMSFRKHVRLLLSVCTATLWKLRLSESVLEKCHRILSL